MITGHKKRILKKYDYLLFLSEVFQYRFRWSFYGSLDNDKSNPNLNIIHLAEKARGPVV